MNANDLEAMAEEWRNQIELRLAPAEQKHPEAWVHKTRLEHSGLTSESERVTKMQESDDAFLYIAMIRIMVRLLPSLRTFLPFSNNLSVLVSLYVGNIAS